MAQSGGALLKRLKIDPRHQPRSGIIPNKTFLAGNTSGIQVSWNLPLLMQEKPSSDRRIPGQEEYTLLRQTLKLNRTGDPSKYLSSRNFFFSLKPHIHARRWRELSNFQRCLWQTQKVRKDIEVDHKQYTVVGSPLRNAPGVLYYRFQL